MHESFSIVKKGYDPEEVNEYIEQLEGIIKSYKEKDHAIKNAIISAQIAADNIIKNAELEAASKKIKAVEFVKSLSNSLQEQKNLLKEFQSDYNALIKKYLVDFDDREYLNMFSKINEIEEYLTNLHESEKNNITLDATKPIPNLDNLNIQNSNN